MKSNIIYLGLALVTGALIPVQASTNAAFSKRIGSPSITGIMVFAIGLLVMSLFVLISGQSMPPARQFSSIPLYAYPGGFIVATYVIMITFLVPRVGIATAISFVVTGQIICAVIIDHFGFFNAPVHAVSIARITGVLLMIGGIYFVMKK